MTGVMKNIWRKHWPKEREGPPRYSAGHITKFKRPYRRQRRNWRDLVPEPELKEIHCG